MRFDRRFRRRLRRFILAGALAAAVWVPVAAATPAQSAPAGFVQVGGDLVQRSQLPAWRHLELRGSRSSSLPSAATAAATGASGYDWRDTAIGIAAFAAACLVLGGFYVARRRARLTPA